MRLNTMLVKQFNIEETVTEALLVMYMRLKMVLFIRILVNNYILNGITRKVIKWTEDEDIPFKEEAFTVEFLKMLMKSLFLVHLLK